ncbi:MULTISPECIES: hypothetical protein [Pseudarthrobacter]|uniref:hypothetical protein n=1 Tax=Pseudarthrobacter TaxID=1742993 RepID=UPI001AD6DDAB|nr:MULTISPECIES: hypothetical protein [Pseudarthrobacter]MDQ0000127.1 hypothetical protein [Pseudarthrobacter sulfonivorans]
MHAESLPQTLDDAVHDKYLSAVATRQYDLLPDILVEGSRTVHRPDDPSDNGDYSAGHALCLMVDTIRVFNGELGTVGRGQQVYQSDSMGRHEQAVLWLPWIHALETLSLATGESLGAYSQALREEYVNINGPGVSTTETKRMLRLWKESTPFMLKWLRWSRTHEIREVFREEDLHLRGLNDIISYTESLSKNWTARGKALQDELSDWAMDQSDWGRLIKSQMPSMDDDD